VDDVTLASSQFAALFALLVTAAQADSAGRRVSFGFLGTVFVGSNAAARDGYATLGRARDALERGTRKDLA
jgi:hypothetical protein